MRSCYPSLAVICLIAIGLPAVAQDKTADQSKKTEQVKLEGLTLVVPADWEREEAANRLRLAQFQVPQANGDAQPTELVVYHFGGAAGGVDANIARWINQFTGRGRTVDLKKGASPQGVYYLVDISGTYNMPVGPPIRRKTKELPDARMLAIILQVEDQGNYFLKMAGPEKTVASQLEALRASIQGNKDSEQPYEIK